MIRTTMTMEQRVWVDRRVRADARRAAEEPRGEINVVAFLDIVMNVLMFVLATTATVFTAEIRTAAPTSIGGRAPTSETLTVMVTPRGYLVASSRGTVSRGCDAIGGGDVTVPTRDGAYDAGALTRCLARVRGSMVFGEALRGQRRVQVSSHGVVAYGELVRAIDAARETEPGAGDLFPDAELGVVQ